MGVDYINCRFAPGLPPGRSTGTRDWGKGTRVGSWYLRLIDSCISQLKAQGPSRTCNESKEEAEEGWGAGRHMFPCSSPLYLPERVY